MIKNERLQWAINWLTREGMSISDDLTAADIIDWAEQAQDNDNNARAQGYDDINDWAQSTGHACFMSDYDEPINPHMANR